MAQIFAGLFTEGPTDARFLEPIIKKALDQIAFECSGQIDIELTAIKIDKSGLGFIEQVLDASKKGIDEFGMTILCVQTDADNRLLADTYRNKILPAISALNNQNEDEYCKILVAVIPIQETEAWMLADTDLLKREIGTNKTDVELRLHRPPETVANPKEVIANAIRIAREDLSQRRRRNLSIADIYGIIGETIALESLENLSSFQDFNRNLRDAFVKLNLLH